MDATWRDASIMNSNREIRSFRAVGEAFLVFCYYILMGKETKLDVYLRNVGEGLAVVLNLNCFSNVQGGVTQC